MPFEKPSQERPEKEKLPIEKQLERLRKELRNVADNLRDNGIAVGDDARADMKAFIGVYTESNVSMNILNAERLNDVFEDKAQRKLLGTNPKAFENSSKTGKYEGEKMKKSGEQLEALKTVIFHKFLNDHFLTLRTALHDDTKNKVDNLIMDRASGNLVGAFDDVADDGSRFNEKQELIRKRNLDGGGTVKYGFKLTEDRKVVPSKTQENIPIFHLALSRAELEQGLSDLSAGPEKTDEERELFNKFLASIESQLLDFRKLQKEGTKLNENLVGRIESFAKKLEEIKGSI